MILTKPLPRVGLSDDGKKKTLTSTMIHITESGVSQASSVRVQFVREIACRGAFAERVLQRDSFWVGSELLFIPFWCRYVNGHRASVPGIVVAESCFSGRSVHYHSFFVLHPASFLCPAYYG